MSHAKAIMAKLYSLKTSNQENDDIWLHLIVVLLISVVVADGVSDASLRKPASVVRRRPGPPAPALDQYPRRSPLTCAPRAAPQIFTLWKQIITSFICLFVRRTAQ